MTPCCGGCADGKKKDQVPSEPTFSRAFREFAQSKLPERVHEALIKRMLPDHLIDAGDGQIPISCRLTSASLHDSQASIPLTAMTYHRVTSLYELKDSAYDCQHITAYSRSLGHVPIIEPKGKTPEKASGIPLQRKTVNCVQILLKKAHQ